VNLYGKRYTHVCNSTYHQLCDFARIVTKFAPLLNTVPSEIHSEEGSATAFVSRYL